MIPTYNRSKELYIAVNSVLKQTYPIYEILVCDDGSSDNSKEEISYLKNPIVRWIDCGKNGGPAIPRNIGIKESKGEWVAFLDSDDEWKPDKIEKQLSFSKKYSLNAVCSNANKIRLSKNEGLYTKFDNEKISFNDLVFENYIICSSVLIQKELLITTSLFPEEKKYIALEDYCLWLRISTKTEFAFVNEGLVNYYDNIDTSLRSDFKRESLSMLEFVFFDLKHWIKQNKIRLSIKKIIGLRKMINKIKRKGETSFFDKVLNKISGYFVNRKQ